MKKKFLAMIMALAMAFSLCSCGIKPYDKPELVTIEASQTAFLIDLIGDSENQASFESEDMLAKAKVASKEVQIPHRWVQLGRFASEGEWRPTAKLIVVERTPVTREWNSTKDGGTSAQNQAIYAESAESIGFSVGMNCSAQIYSEDDAVRFLYEYNGKSLEEIMDTEIRARVETVFGEKCGVIPINDIIKRKAEIMTELRDDVQKYFKKKGIDITTLGLKDGIEYDDPAIQQAINDKFSSEQKLVTQKNMNAVTVAEAEAKAEAKLIAAEADAKANKMLSDSITPELNRAREIEKWNGSYATIVGSEGVIVDAKTSSKKK